MKKKLNPYRGSILGVPWKLPDFAATNPFKSEAQRNLALRQQRDYIRSGFTERLDCLYKHFGIEPESPGAEFRLLMALAQRHVPGFNLLDPNHAMRGRPPIWKSKAGVQLYVDVQMLIRRKGMNPSSACSYLVECPNYRGMSPKTLRTRYQEFKNSEGSMKNAALILEEATFNMLAERDSK